MTLEPRAEAAPHRPATRNRWSSASANSRNCLSPLALACRTPNNFSKLANLRTL